MPKTAISSRTAGVAFLCVLAGALTPSCKRTAASPQPAGTAAAQAPPIARDIDLEVDFTGLIAAVRYNKDYTKPQRMSMLLLDAGGLNPDPGYGLHEHVPTLTTNVANLEKSTLDAGQALRGPDDQQYVSWNISGKILSFELSSSTPNTLDINQSKILTARQARHFDWVGDLRLGGYDQQIAASNLHLSPKPAAVLARVDVGFGTIASLVRCNDEGGIMKWSFRDGNNSSSISTPQPLSEVIRWTHKYPRSEQLVIKLAEFATPKVNTITFKSGIKDDLWIGISHLPTKIVKPSQQEQDKIKHFAAYYSLLRSPPGSWKERKYPHLLAERSDREQQYPEPRSLKPIRCVPGSAWTQ